MTTSELSPELQAAIRAATPECVSRSQGFDAIVIGTGAAGGLASLLLTEGGMSVLLLDAGWKPKFRQSPFRQTTAALIKRIADPRWQSVLPIGAMTLGRKVLRTAGKLNQPIQTRCFAWEMAPDAFVDDKENPYITEAGTRFDWFRSRQIGGRMTIPGHGRQYYRFSAHDLEPSGRSGEPWPIPYSELSSWYDVVEARLGLASGLEDCAWVPPGKVGRLSEASAAESTTIEAIKARWPSVAPILGRSAPPLRSVDLAAATGRLVCRSGGIASHFEFTPDGRKRVWWKDRATGTDMSAVAPIVFVCASALETTRILLQSRNSSGEAIGVKSDMLGRCLMDHVVLSSEGVGGALSDSPEPLTPGRCVYLPRFDLRDAQSDGGPGYGVQIYRWSLGRDRSSFTGVAFAEMSPRRDNRVVLHSERKDAWGLPILQIRCEHSQAELASAKDQSQALQDIADTLGVRLHRLDESAAAPGTAIHECGTARMGGKPETSVLDPDCQCWDAEGVFVTDAAAFPSQGAQNPTLTIMALTARSCMKVLKSSGYLQS